MCYDYEYYCNKLSIHCTVEGFSYGNRQCAFVKGSNTTGDKIISILLHYYQ